MRGEKDIKPPLAEATAMCRSRRAEFTARFLLCVSETGVPAKIVVAELSGAPAWDRALFENMRTWRYAPLIGERGAPEPACHGVTFVYRPGPGCRGQ